MHERAPIRVKCGQIRSDIQKTQKMSQFQDKTLQQMVFVTKEGRFSCNLVQQQQDKQKFSLCLRCEMK